MSLGIGNPIVTEATFETPGTVLAGTFGKQLLQQDTKRFAQDLLSMPQSDLTLIVTAPDDIVEGYLGDIPDNFASTNGLTTAKALQLGNSVTSIGDYAFHNCDGFTGDLTIPDSVTSIGNYAFASCIGFTGNLTIGNSVITIGNLAFDSCSGFTGDLTIPDSVTSIGTYAFGWCFGLTNVNCYVTKTIFDQTNVITGSGITTIHARSSDVTWTEGADTIGGQAVTVIKDLT